MRHFGVGLDFFTGGRIDSFQSHHASSLVRK
jgi:hypothetical protein